MCVSKVRRNSDISRSQPLRSSSAFAAATDRPTSTQYTFTASHPKPVFTLRQHKNAVLVCLLHNGSCSRRDSELDGVLLKTGTQRGWTEHHARRTKRHGSRRQWGRDAMRGVTGKEKSRTIPPQTSSEAGTTCRIGSRKGVQIPYRQTRISPHVMDRIKLGAYTWEAHLSGTRGPHWDFGNLRLSCMSN